MNSKQKKTLRAIFEQPTRSDIAWADIESLFQALEGEMSEGRGSRVRVRLNDRVAVFHRPHPKPNACKGLVEGVRDLLIGAGYSP